MSTGTLTIGGCPTVGQWGPAARRGACTRRRYVVAGVTRGHVEEIGLFRAVGTVYGADGRRHQRPFSSASEARQWVADNVPTD